jgi:hypothetical protein
MPGSCRRGHSCREQSTGQGSKPPPPRHHPVGLDAGHPDLAAPNVITGTGSCDRSTERRESGLPPCYPWARDPCEARSWAKAGRAWLGCTGAHAGRMHARPRLHDDYAAWSTKSLAPTCSIADGHGTHCSGIIGAVDNAQGVRGAIGSGVRIHAYACLDETGNGGDTEVGFAAALSAAGWLDAA